MIITVAGYLKTDTLNTVEDAFKLFQVIREMILDRQEVRLDFEGVVYYSSTFWQSCLGRLYMYLTPTEISERLRFVNLPETELAAIAKVVEYGSKFGAPIPRH